MKTITEVSEVAPDNHKTLSFKHFFAGQHLRLCSNQYDITNQGSGDNFGHGSIQAKKKNYN